MLGLSLGHRGNGKAMMRFVSLSYKAKILEEGFSKYKRIRRSYE